MRRALVFVGAAWLLGGCFFFEIDVGDELTDAGGPPPGADATIVPSDAMPPATCAQPVICPPPAGNKAALCGWVHDTETTQPILPANVPFRVSAYTALDFASNPDDPGAHLTSVEPDACGRFVLSVTVPGSQFIAIETDDVPGGSDHLARTAVMAIGVQSGKVEGIRAYATRQSTNQGWSTTANLPPPTFAERGVYLPIFIDTTRSSVGPFAGTPAAGVTVMEDGTPTHANDFYFSDTDALTRASVNSTSSVTGANGAALYMNGSLVEYSGTGAEAAGCEWTTTLGATIPGVVMVKEHGLMLCN